MAQTIGLGGTIRLDAQYLNGAGVLTDPTNPRITILDALDVAVVVNGIPTRLSVGLYYYDYVVPTNAPKGVWTARWSGVMAGIALIPVDDLFEVVDAGIITFDSTNNIAYLRNLLDDAPSQANEKATFNDDILREMLYRNSGDVYAAAADGWDMKSAYFSRMLAHPAAGDVDRDYTVLFRNARRMAEYYRAMAGPPSSPGMAMGRTLGRVISLREPPTPVWDPRVDRMTVIEEEV